MAIYPQELAQDAVCQSRTGHMTELWFLPARPLRLNTNEWVITLGSKLKEFRQETECGSETKMLGSGPRPYLPCFSMCLCDCMYILQWIYTPNVVHGAGDNTNRRRRRHVIRLGSCKKSLSCQCRKRTWFLTFPPKEIYGLKAGLICLRCCMTQ